MADDNPSILSHVSVGTNDFAAATAFYDAALGALGIGRVMDHPGAQAYGKQFPEFWVQQPIDGAPASDWLRRSLVSARHSGQHGCAVDLRALR